MTSSDHSVEEIPGDDRELECEPDHDAILDLPAIEFAELLFFAYRDFISDPDAILEPLGFGRAHHRVLHFVTRHPGMRVAELLEILKITKQSLARVLKQLIDEGYVAQHAGEKDRRARLLHSTQKGRQLTLRLAGMQARRVATALAMAGPGAKDVVRLFLSNMITETNRSEVAKLIAPDAATQSTGTVGEPLIKGHLAEETGK